MVFFQQDLCASVLYQYYSTGKQHLKQEDHHRDRYYAQDRRHYVIDTRLHRVFAADDGQLDDGAAAGGAGADRNDQGDGAHRGVALNVSADIQEQDADDWQYDESQE